MKSEQKALIISTDGNKTTGLSELNQLLGSGWHVVEISPMGGAGKDVPRLASLVIVERGSDLAAAMLEVSEEAEELLGELSDGDGAGSAPPTSLPRP